MKILKFGGKSLANGHPLENVLNIIQKETEKSPVTVVVSARGNSTDQLLSLYNKAVEGENYLDDLQEFIEYQKGAKTELDFTSFHQELKLVLSAIQLLGVNDKKAEDKVLAYGEIIAAKTISSLLENSGSKPVFTDARSLLKVKNEGLSNEIDLDSSRSLTKDYFNQIRSNQIPVVTGFIASNNRGETVTLGRNGTNYSATLFANFLKAKEVQNWTDVNGIFSASPKYVKSAQKIPSLNYKEANELANFGANILHAKTILPLVEEEIPLRICNSFSPDETGTIINKKGGEKGIKAVSVIENVSLISIEGRGFSGKVGIDARIFSALSQNNINVRLISQASSERGVGFVVDQEDGDLAIEVLQNEFASEIENKEVLGVSINNDMAVIAIVGRHNYALEKAIRGLRRNKIWLHLISNSITGEHISLVVENSKLKKAVNVVHNHVFGAIKTLNLFAIGKGTVGGQLLNQIIETSEDVIQQRGLKINVIGVADSKRFLFDEEGLGRDWKAQLEKSENSTDFDQIIDLLKSSSLENIVIADNTASEEVTQLYPEFVKQGFDIVASNKKANSIEFSFYDDLRKSLKRKGRLFYYETNVGAGLPLIDTLKNLKNSSDSIQKVVGVFSGSLSYIFNHFSIQDKPFSEVLLEAKELGLTEPDPREDLSGMDVARKLIILAREIGLKTEFEEVQIDSLIPEELRNIDSYEDFINKKETLDKHFEQLKKDLSVDQVLRYTGELDVNSNTLKVALVKADKSSPLGNIKNSDSIFEIYTEGYGAQPIVIQGAGAGAEVTARGVYSDLLRMGLQY